MVLFSVGLSELLRKLTGKTNLAFIPVYLFGNKVAKEIAGGDRAKIDSLMYRESWSGIAVNDYVTFDFFGDFVYMLTYYGTEPLEVYLDGKYIGKTDDFQTVRIERNQIIKIAEGLSDEKHTIKFVKTGTVSFVIGIIVSGSKNFDVIHRVLNETNMFLLKYGSMSVSGNSSVTLIDSWDGFVKTIIALIKTNGDSKLIVREYDYYDNMIREIVKNISGASTTYLSVERIGYRYKVIFQDVSGADNGIKYTIQGVVR